MSLLGSTGSDRAGRVAEQHPSLPGTVALEALIWGGGYGSATAPAGQA